SDVCSSDVIFHPCGYISKTVRDPRRDSGVLRRERQKQLSIICIMQDMYNTCCFPSPSATQPSPHPPFLSPPGRPQADGSPLMCCGSASGSFLTNREFFLARVANVLALRGFRLWAL